MKTSAADTMVPRLGRLIDRALQPIVDPRSVLHAIRGYPRFLRSFREYSRKSPDQVRILDLWQQKSISTTLSGSRTTAYRQDLWQKTGPRPTTLAGFTECH
jgi:hypothetical protein